MRRISKSLCRGPSATRATQILLTAAFVLCVLPSQLFASKAQEAARQQDAEFLFLCIAGALLLVLIANWLWMLRIFCKFLGYPAIFIKERNSLLKVALLGANLFLAGYCYVHCDSAMTKEVSDYQARQRIEKENWERTRERMYRQASGLDAVALAIGEGIALPVCGGLELVEKGAVSVVMFIIMAVHILGYIFGVVLLLCTYYTLTRIRRLAGWILAHLGSDRGKSQLPMTIGLDTSPGVQAGEH